MANIIIKHRSEFAQMMSRAVRPMRGGLIEWSAE